jgi:hypothetical protein
VRARKCAQDVLVQEDGEGICAKEEELKAEWRKLRNEKLHDLYTVLLITSRRMRLVGHVARVGEKRYPEFGWRILKERGHLEDKEVDRRIPFKFRYSASVSTQQKRVRIIVTETERR